MNSEVKDAVSPVVNLLKELNSQLKNGEVEIDLVVKIATTMKVSAIQLDRISKTNKMKISGGVVNPPTSEEQND